MSHSAVSPLDRLTESSPAMRSAASVVRALARDICRQATAIAGRWPDHVPDAVAAEARVAAGVAALEGEPLLGGRELLRGARALGTAVADVERDVGQTVLGVVAQLEAATLSEAALDDLAGVSAVGAWEAIAPLAARLDIDEYALLSVLDYAARPALLAGASRIGHLASGSDRLSVRCPVCGSPPLLAELSGRDGSRTLRCARCGTHWAYPRLACAWCGERDHRALSALHGDGDAGVRHADCCRTCHGYLKAVSVLEPLEYVALLETDLATAGLDLVAIERGYTRAPASAGSHHP